MKKCCKNCEFYTVYDDCVNPVILDSLYDDDAGCCSSNSLRFDPDDTSKFFCSEFKPKEVTDEN